MQGTLLQQITDRWLNAVAPAIIQTRGQFAQAERFNYATVPAARKAVETIEDDARDMRYMRELRERQEGQVSLRCR